MKKTRIKIRLLLSELQNHHYSSKYGNKKNEHKKIAGIFENKKVTDQNVQKDIS